MNLEKPILWLLLLVALLLGLYAVTGYFAISLQPVATATPPASSRSNVAYVPPAPPPMAAYTVDAQSKGFYALVSYTDRGFEPATLAVHTGDRVRFTNNTSREMWVAAAGSAATPIYPGVGACDASPLDTCGVLKPGEFWEFTFDAAGTWQYADNRNKANEGTVNVTP